MEHWLIGGLRELLWNHTHRRRLLKEIMHVCVQVHGRTRAHGRVFACAGGRVGVDDFLQTTEE